MISMSLLVLSLAALGLGAYLVTRSLDGTHSPGRSYFLLSLGVVFMMPGAVGVLASLAVLIGM